MQDITFFITSHACVSPERDSMTPYVKQASHKRVEPFESGVVCASLNPDKILVPSIGDFIKNRSTNIFLTFSTLIQE